MPYSGSFPLQRWLEPRRDSMEVLAKPMPSLATSAARPWRAMLIAASTDIAAPRGLIRLEKAQC
jgi:hypothetical protein